MKYSDNGSNAEIKGQMVDGTLKKKPLRRDSKLSVAEILKLIHKLEAYQAKLNIQNKELMRKQSRINLTEISEQIQAQSDLSEKRAAELIIADKELLFQSGEKDKRAAELIIADKELSFQSKEKEKRAAELIIANQELLFQNKEKEKRAAELIIANKELLFQNNEKEKRAAELIIANKELLFQNKEKDKRAAELRIAEHELQFQNKEKEKRAAELIIANKNLLYQNKEKEKRAAELFIANKELLFQNNEKEKRADELIIANKELLFQNKEKDKRAAELIIADNELLFQNKEKEKRADELSIANKELLFQNEEKEKRASELIIALEGAKSADRLKSVFLATMSHELRTPLNSIIGFSGILLMEKAGGLNEEQKKQLGMIQMSSRHLLALISEILDLSMIEEKQLIINCEKFNVQDVIEEAMNGEKASAKRKGILLRFEKTSDFEDIVSDRKRVSQVIMNLLNNAVKFTRKGSVEIECCKVDHVVKIDVVDTGIGIKNKHLDGLFNPFIQVDNSLTRKHEGSGLGLSISKKLIELLQGTISVRSEFGAGSTFTITLPLTTG